MNAGTHRGNLAAAIILALSVYGCGTSGQSSDDEIINMQSFSMLARLEYRIDSMIIENRRITQQVDALAAENRILAARILDFDSRPGEAPPPLPPQQQQSRQMQQSPAPVVRAPAPDVTMGYPQALTAYRMKNFQDAIAGFEALLLGGIQEDLADNCHYWIGECNYAMGRYADAVNHFEMVSGYPRSEKKDDAQMMIGNSYTALGRKTEAREAYNKLLSVYPASIYAKKAQERLVQN